MTQPSGAPRIDGERLLADLRALRAFGARGTGVVRPALSKPDIEARQWLKRRMQEAGLDARIDRVGNVVGVSNRSSRSVLVGSHSDTQPEGGWLDGALGVVYGLEIARALAESSSAARCAVDVASWVDEEARFAQYLGSRFFVGEVSEAEIQTATDSQGHRLTDALAALAPHAQDGHRFDPARHRAYFEAHIEQGRVLEAENLRFGIVTSIVGAREFLIEFRGSANHAGTTPMGLRSDAAMALFRAATQLDCEFRRHAGSDTVWNVNSVNITPASASIVASKAQAVVQFRDSDCERLEQLAALLPEVIQNAACKSQATVERCEQIFTISPAPMHRKLQDIISKAAEETQPNSQRRMASGAGHDAQIFSAYLPTAMLFIPSIGGVSHSFAEDTSLGDIVLGCQAAASAVVEIFRWMERDMRSSAS